MVCGYPFIPRVGFMCAWHRYSWSSTFTPKSNLAYSMRPGRIDTTSHVLIYPEWGLLASTLATHLSPE